MPGARGTVAFEKAAAATEAAHLLPQGKRQGTATGSQLALNLVVCGLGTGIFTLPWSTAGASVFPAISIIAGVLAVNAWTISFLVEAAERHQKFDIGSLLACIPGSLGPWARIGCNVALCFSTYLCLVSYIIVIVDCLGQSLPAWALTKRSTLVVLAAALVLPLCFLDQQRLSSTSLVAVLANVYIFMVVVGLFVHEDLEGKRPPVCYLGASTGSIAMVSAMMQTVVIQMCVLPMYAEMRDRSVASFNRVVAVSFSALFLLCAGFSVLGYLTFGQGASSNVLLDLPTTRWGSVARLGAAAGVVGVYPIIMSPIVAALRGSPAALALLRHWQGGRHCRHHRCCVRKHGGRSLLQGSGAT